MHHWRYYIYNKCLHHHTMLSSCTARSCGRETNTTNNIRYTAIRYTMSLPLIPKQETNLTDKRHSVHQISLHSHLNPAPKQNLQPRTRVLHLFILPPNIKKAAFFMKQKRRKPEIMDVQSTTQQLPPRQICEWRPDPPGFMKVCQVV